MPCELYKRLMQKAESANGEYAPWEVSGRERSQLRKASFAKRDKAIVGCFDHLSLCEECKLDRAAAQVPLKRNALPHV
jgi:hypothetical protein